MTDSTSNTSAADNAGPLPAVSNPFSSQPTGLVETIFAETLGLSMHNAVASQQSSQMTTAASITNACARLLQSPVPKAPQKKEKEKKAEAEPAKAAAEPAQAPVEAPPAKKKFNIMNFLKPKKKTQESTERTEPTASTTDDDGAETQATQEPTEAKS